MSAPPWSDRAKDENKDGKRAALPPLDALVASSETKPTPLPLGEGSHTVQQVHPSLLHVPRVTSATLQ